MYIYQDAGEGTDHLNILKRIAAEFLYAYSKHIEAAHERPLAYIECLLNAVSDHGGWDLGEVPDDLVRLIPGLELEQSITLVSLFLDKSRPHAPVCE